MSSPPGGSTPQFPHGSVTPTHNNTAARHTNTNAANPDLSSTSIPSFPAGTQNNQFRTPSPFATNSEPQMPGGFFDTPGSNRSADYSQNPVSPPGVGPKPNDDPVLVYKSYLTDIDYSKHQQRYLNEGVPDTSSEPWGTDYSAQRQQVLQQIKDRYGYQVQKQWSPDFIMRSLAYHAKDPHNNHVTIKVSPDSNLAPSVHGILNEWYVLSGLNVVEPRVLCHDSNYLSSEAIRTPRTLPRDLPGIMYPQKVLSLHVPNESGRKYALVYEHTEDYVILRNFYKKEVVTEVYDEFSASSGSNPGTTNGTTVPGDITRGASLPNISNVTKQSLLTTTSFPEAPHLAKSASINTKPPPTIHSGTKTVSSNARSVHSNPVVEGPNHLLREMYRTPLEVVDILDDILQLVRTLARIHELGFVYNTISQVTVVKSKVSGHVKLAGFEYCFSVQPEDGSNSFRRPYLASIPDHLAYMSPETVDDSHKGADFRSDLYSVGVLMYELLVGRLPFVSSNPAKLIRMQVLHKPVAPEVIAGAWITSELNNVIMKLLEKDPWKRFPDCVTLIHELVNIKNGYIDDINSVPGSSANLPMDTSVSFSPMKDLEKVYATQSFILPRKLFGRDDINDQLVSAFNNMTAGVNGLVIKGPPGSGKTTMLRGLRDMAIGTQSFYIYYKFSKSGENENIYGAFVQGLTSCIRQILRCSTEIIESWRHKIISNVPVDLSIMMSLIPEFRTLIGPKYSSILRDKRHKHTSSDPETVDPKQDPDTVQSPTEEPDLEIPTFSLELRLRYLIKTLFGVFSANGCTVMLDDIQYCSGHEFRMCTEILEHFTTSDIRSQVQVKYFFGYHDHPSGKVKLDDLIYQCSRFDVPIDVISLEPVSLEDFSQYWSHCAVSHNHNVGLNKSPPTSTDAMKDEPLSPTASSPRASTFSPSPLRSATLSPPPHPLARETTSRESTPLDAKSDSNFVDEKLLLNAERLYQLSGGNMLHSRYLAGLIFWSGKATYTSRRGQVDGKWDFDLSDPDLETQTMKDTISRLMDVTLSHDCRKLLKFAAIAFTSDFNLAGLTHLSGFSLEETFRLVNIALRIRLIIPINPFYKIPFHLLQSGHTPFDMPHDMVWELAANTEFRFFHDSIRDALYEELVETNELQAYNQMCGLRCYNLIDKDFSILGYLKMGWYFCESASLVTDNYRDLYFDVLITTGRCCVGTYRIEDALKCFELATKFAPENSRNLQLKVFLTICQLHFYLENYQTCLELIEDGCKKFKVDETAFLVTKVRCLSNLHRFDEVLDVSIRGLQRLGVEISENVDECEAIAIKYENKTPLSIQEIRNLKQVPVAKNPRILFAYEVMANIIQPTYFATYGHLKKALVYQMIDMMAHHGSSVFCSVALIFVANSLAKQLERAKFLRAIEYTEVAMSLVDTSKTVSFSFIQTVYEIYLSTIAVYMEPLPDLLSYHETFIASARTFFTPGSWSRDMITGIVSLHLLYVTGHTYDYMQNYLSRRNNEYYSLFKDEFHNLEHTGLQLFHNDISVEQFDASLDKSITSPDYVFVALVFKVYSLVTDGKFRAAIQLVVNSADTDALLPNTLLHAYLYFLVGIALARVKTGPETKDSDARLAAKTLAFFELGNEVCPVNFRSKALIIKAALNVDNKLSDIERLDLFEEAIDDIKKYGNQYDEAWGCYLCASWLMGTCLFKRKIIEYAKTCITLFNRLEIKLAESLALRSFEDYLNAHSWAGINSLDPQHTPRAASSPLPSPNPLSKKLSEFFVSNYQSNSSQKGAILGGSSTPKIDPSMSPSSKLDFGISPDTRGPIAFDDSILSNDSSSVNLNEAVKACLQISDADNDGLILMRLLQCAIQFSDVDYGVIVTKKKGEPFISAIGSRNSIYNLLKEPLSSRTDLCPFSLIQHVLLNGTVINKDEDAVLFETTFSKDDYFQANTCYSLVCIPLMSSKGVEGALYLESQQEVSRRPSLGLQPFFNSTKRDLIELLCSQATVALTKIELYTQMEHAKRVAEDATAEKASFLANMSHEIRTPFNSLLSCSIFLLDTDLDKTQREYVETIRSSAMVTLNIIDGILAFSKIEHGSFTLENEPFSLIESVENAIQLVGEQAAMNDLELVFFNKCPTIKNIFGDETRFRQIIINLVGNAVKFTSQGHILVEVKAKEITQNRYEICVSVEDTGIGIPNDSNNKVFGAFSQVDSSSRRIYGGSGLGLAISKKLADLMGGTLTFDSVEGQGSTFYFVVNMEVELFEGPEIEFDDEMAAKLGTTRKSLVIDDHILTRQSLYENLRMFGLEVDVADTAESLLTMPAPQISQYNSIFIHHDKFTAFNNIKRQLKLSPVTQIVLISQFGKILPPQVDDSDIFSVLLVPFQKPKIIELLRNLKSTQKQSIKPPPNPDDINNKQFAKKYPLSILIAEDNLINLKVALQHLKKLGYDADHAKDGVETIDKCINLLSQDKHYDVIFMDIQMPRKDGITAAIELRELFEGNGKSSYLPEIVALTANVAGEDRQRSLECGMIDFVSKPILPQNLITVLQKIGQRKFDR